MNPDFLKKNCIFKGNYEYNEESCICFFEKKDDNKVYDVITNKEIDINMIQTIESEFDLKFFKYVRRLHKNNKNYNVFKTKDFENYFFESEFFYKILTHFGIENYKTVFEKNQKQEILDHVIEKITKYSKRYFGEENSKIYANYLKNYNSIIELLTFIPEELLNIKVPFWIEDLYKLKTNKSIFVGNIEFKIYEINVMKDVMDHNMTIEEVVDDPDLIELKVKKLEEIEFIQNYKDACINALKKRIEESEVVLSNEKHYAEKNKDTDLLFEINVLLEELEKLKEDIYNIDFLNPNLTSRDWWPDLLYPSENIDMYSFFNNELVLKLWKVRNECFIHCNKPQPFERIKEKLSK